MNLITQNLQSFTFGLLIGSFVSFNLFFYSKCNLNEPCARKQIVYPVEASISSSVDPKTELLRAETIHELTSQNRIACIVLTRPETHLSRAQHLKNTWGKRCDGLFIFTTSDGTNNTIGAIPLDVEEGREWLWLKAKLAFWYMFEEQFDEFDWFYKADDDTFVVVENLRNFLQNKSTNDPIAFGYKLFQPELKSHYFSGGAGYVMSRTALQRFVEDGVNDGLCWKKDKGNEDFNVGLCLGQLGVNLVHAMDDKNRPLFHPFRPGSVLINVYDDIIPPWLKNYSVVEPQFGSGAIAEYPISFHYVTNLDMYSFDYFAYEFQKHNKIE